MASGMQSYTSTELLRMLANPLTKGLLLDQWPSVRCVKKDKPATAICAITFVDSSGDTWVEFAALCAECCLSNYGRGVVSERACPPMYCPKRIRVDILYTVTNQRWHQATGIWT